MTTDETNEQPADSDAEATPDSSPSAVQTEAVSPTVDGAEQERETPDTTNAQPEVAGTPAAEPQTEAGSPIEAGPLVEAGSDPPTSVEAAETSAVENAESGDPPAPTPDASESSQTVEAPPQTGEPPQADAPTGPRTIKIGSQRDDDAAATGIKATPQNLAPGKDTAAAALAAEAEADAAATQQQKQYPPPRLESKITPEIQKELDAAMGDLAIDDLMLSGSAAATEDLEEGAQTSGNVLSIRGDSVFVDLGRRNQGIVSVKQFKELPAIGSSIDTIVSKFDAEEGVYELVIPDAAVDVAGWSELSQGMVVEAVVTGHNKGGLEVEVNRLRGFMPISQIALFRVENLEEFVGQKFSCVVTEADPARRNLVVSRRSILEREKAEAKEKLLGTLEVGQMHEGVVSRLQPFGAFVDLGGVDGLVHISQLSWDRVKHPNEVLSEGQTIKVRISKIDPKSGKIGLAYRDTFENPWTTVEQRYKPKDRVTGTISRLMDFGAFVRLEAGIEGLIHISELAHRRVFRSSDVVSEGQQVDIQILSIDPQAQRISLSLKALEANPDAGKRKKDDKDDDVPVPSPSLPKTRHKGDLKGGTNRPSGGEEFGLKW